MTKRNIRALIILGIILIFAIATSLMLNNLFKQEQSDDGLIVVSEVNFNTVNAMSIKEGDNSLSLFLKDGQWYAAETDEPIDQVKASSMSTHLCYVYADKIIANKADDLSIYGLEPAKVTAQLNTNDGKTHTFYYGTSTIDNNSVFMMKQGDPHIYTVVNEHYNQLINNITNLKDLSVPQIGELMAVGFSGKNGQTALLRQESNGIYPTDWRIELPYIAPVLPYAIETITDTVNGLRLESYLGDEYKEEYGIDENSDWFACTDTNGETLTIMFGEDKNEYYTYCTVSNKAGYYTISKNKFQFVDFMTSEFIDAQMINNPQGIIGVQFSGPDASFTYTQDGQSFMFNGLSIDNETYNNMVALLKSIRIMGAVNGDIAQEPSYTITLRLDALPNTATIKLYEYNKSFYAVDYGDGANVYVPAEDIELFVSSLSTLENK